MNSVNRRLDQAMVSTGKARSRSQASELIRAGKVKVNGHIRSRPSAPVSASDLIECEIDPWVSRAAHKLIGALEQSQLTIPARVLDAGASTGGFTQVLLNRGAQSVYAVDVGHGQLASSIREDPRVKVREGLNLRDLELSDLDNECVDLAVADVSFISLQMLIKPIFQVLGPHASALLMIKPQFEVGREKLGAGGVVESADDRESAIHAVIDKAAALGWSPRWQADSVLPGPAGNLEHFVLFSKTVDS